MLTKKNIWIISQESSTPDTGYGGRSYYFAQEFVNKGYNVSLILSSSSHMLRLKPCGYKEKIAIEEHDGLKVIWVKTIDYKGANNNKRVFGWFLFALKLLQIRKIVGHKPDTIIYSSPPLIPFIGALLLKTLFKAKLIFEVRDIWPLTLTEIGGISTKHPFIVLSSLVERLAYKFADKIVSNLQFADEHIKTKYAGLNKFTWIANGISETNVLNEVESNLISVLPKNKFIIGYTGSIGKANFLEQLIDAAEVLKENHKIQFIIVGDGAEKKYLHEKVVALKLSNVLFFNAVPKNEVQSVISSFDICYLGCESIDLYKYGISPNKLSEYMYAGKPVLLSYSGEGEIIQSNNAGLTVDAENTELITKAILKFQQLNATELKRMGENGKRYVKDNLTYKVLADKYEKLI
jgi:glycosyltransferase involved in cell wall biosynthesis